MKNRTPDRRLVGMFCLGAVSGFVQVMLMRELLVVFLGNEVSIGAILACWFTGISLGAISATAVVRRGSAAALSWWPAAFFFIFLAILPVQVAVIRTLRSVLDVATGEYAPLLSILLSSCAVLLPSGICIGLLFPIACRLVAAEGEEGIAPVTRIYGWEAAGSMVGGVVLTLLLLPLLSTIQILALTMLTGLFGVAMFLPQRVMGRIIAGLAVGCVALVLACPGALDPVRARVDALRWRALGLVGEVAASRDTVYQNLAITELAGQHTLYANGEVVFVLEDPIDYESRVHFIMAQKPNAQRVLVVGGNVLGEVPELLKYPQIKRVVCVDLDPGVSGIVRDVMPDRFRQVVSDPRVILVHQDAVAYIRKSDDSFDAVLVNAPDPHTLAANRFYTREFFVQVRRILDSGGFLFTSVTSSERLRSEARGLAGSIYRTLREVFPVVLVTAGADTRFFASAGGELTFDRRQLEDRSRSAGLKTEYFDPRVFGGMDEIAADKTRLTEALLNSADVGANTMLVPTAFFYRILLWSRFSGSRVGRILGVAGETQVTKLAAVLVTAGILLGLLGFVLNARSKGRPPACGWNRLVVCGVIASTGFCAMALEVLLIYVFQGVYGYVYTRLGLIMAVFMLGLVLGAPAGRRLMAWRSGSCMGGSLVALECLLLCVALALPWLASWLLSPLQGTGSLRFLELALYGVVMLVGWIVGAEFSVANGIYREQGGSVGAGAAVTDAADHVGAALGSLVIGVILVPVLGVGASCIVVAALKAGGVMVLWGIQYKHRTPNIEHPTSK